jgi:hypothetical protein
VALFPNPPALAGGRLVLFSFAETAKRFKMRFRGYSTLLAQVVALGLNSSDDLCPFMSFFVSRTLLSALNGNARNDDGVRSG